MQTEVRPNFIDHLLKKHGTAENALANLEAAKSVKPVEVRLDLQVFLNALGREEESFAVSDELLRIAPRDPRVLFNRGWHLLKRGEMQNGLVLLEHGRALRTYGHPPLPSSRPLWRPSTGRGQRVLLYLEGGLGDEMIHFRFARDLHEKYDCHVTVICIPALANLFARQPWVAGVAQREAALGIYHDSWLPGMSAALALGYEYEDIPNTPYLSAGAEAIARWTKLLGSHDGKFRIGIRWAGNPEFEHQQLRLFPPSLLTELRKHGGVQLYSFQRDTHLIDLPPEIVDLAPYLRTWDDTAAAVENMDLMISSCTSVAHLSAAMGRETWVVVPALPYFIWARPGRTSPWYQSVRLFRQQKFGDWSAVGELLNQELSEKLARNS